MEKIFLSEFNSEPDDDDDAEDPLLDVKQGKEEEVIPEGFEKRGWSSPSRITPPVVRQYGRSTKRKAAKTQETSPDKNPKEGEYEVYDFPDYYSQPIRMVDLNVMAKCLWCNECNKALSLRDCVEDEHNLFMSVLKIKCLGCKQVKRLALSLLGTDGNCEAYQKTISTRPFNFNVLKEVCLEFGKKVAGGGQNGINKRSRGAENDDGQLQIQHSSLIGKNKENKEDKPVEISQCGVANETSSIDLTKEIPAEKGNIEPSLVAPVAPEKANSADENISVCNDDSMALDGACSEEEFAASDTFEKVCEPLIKNPRMRAPSIRENCLYCNQEFYNFRMATIHMEKEHPDFLKLKCGGCQKQCPSMNSLKRHMVQHRPGFTHLCPHCGKFCYSKRALEIHMFIHVPDEEANVPCPKCDRLFKSQRHLYRHMFSHASAMTCDFCNAKIRNRHQFVYHLKKMHLQNKNHDCEICGAQFYYKSDSDFHFKNNHNWICLVCGLKFNVMEEVRDHCETEHSQEQIEASQNNGVAYEQVTKFQCSHCFAYLPSKQSLEVHLRIHDWICLVCRRKFTLMEEVRDHCAKEHSKKEIKASEINRTPYEKVTDFQCIRCLRYLASRASLNNHLTTHNRIGKRPKTGGRKKKIVVPPSDVDSSDL